MNRTPNNSMGSSVKLRFFLDSRATRITYWIASGRRVILLTIFVKTRQRERHEVDRARRAIQTCIDDDHTLDDD